MKRVPIAVESVGKRQEEITASDVYDARIILGLPTETALLARARDSGGTEVSFPFNMTDELRRLGEHRAGISPEGYQIPRYLCIYVADVLAGEIIASSKMKPGASKRGVLQPPLDRGASRSQ